VSALHALDDGPYQLPSTVDELIEELSLIVDELRVLRGRDAGLRYLSTTERLIITELLHGDICIDQKCYICHKPLEEGQCVAGTLLSHYECSTNKGRLLPWLVERALRGD
jgi:hypothetical protein